MLLLMCSVGDFVQGQNSRLSKTVTAPLRETRPTLNIHTAFYPEMTLLGVYPRDVFTNI